MNGRGVLRRLVRWVLLLGAVWAAREYLFARNLRRYGPPGPPKVTLPDEMGPDETGPAEGGPQSTVPQSTVPEAVVAQSTVPEGIA